MKSLKIKILIYLHSFLKVILNEFEYVTYLSELKCNYSIKFFLKTLKLLEYIVKNKNWFMKWLIEILSLLIILDFNF